MNGGSPPRAPDPSIVAQDQTRLSTEQMWNQLRASSPNVSNPYGSSTWNFTPQFDSNAYQQALTDWEARPGSDKGIRPTEGMFTNYDVQNNMQFSTPMQQQWDAISGHLQNSLNSFDPTARVDLIDDVRGRYSDELAQAIYNRSTRLSDPAMTQARSSLETRLAERGMQVGNEAYNTEMDRFNTNMSEHYSDAADRAQITAANQALAEAGFTNSSRLSEFSTNQNQRLALASTLMNMQNAMAAPAFGNAPGQVQVSLPQVDYAGLVQNRYAGDVANYNAGVQSDNALIGALISGASMIFPPAALAAPALMGSGATFQPMPTNPYQLAPPQGGFNSLRIR